MVSAIRSSTIRGAALHVLERAVDPPPSPSHVFEPRKDWVDAIENRVQTLARA